MNIYFEYIEILLDHPICVQKRTCTNLVACLSVTIPVLTITIKKKIRTGCLKSHYAQHLHYNKVSNNFYNLLTKK